MFPVCTVTTLAKTSIMPSYTKRSIYVHLFQLKRMLCMKAVLIQLIELLKPRPWRWEGDVGKVLGEQKQGGYDSGNTI